MCVLRSYTASDITIVTVYKRNRLINRITVAMATLDTSSHIWICCRVDHLGRLFASYNVMVA